MKISLATCNDEKIPLWGIVINKYKVYKRQLGGV